MAALRVPVAQAIVLAQVSRAMLARTVKMDISVAAAVVAKAAVVVGAVLPAPQLTAVRVAQAAQAVRAQTAP